MCYLCIFVCIVQRDSKHIMRVFIHTNKVTNTRLVFKSVRAACKNAMFVNPSAVFNQIKRKSYYESKIEALHKGEFITVKRNSSKNQLQNLVKNDRF